MDSYTGNRCAFMVESIDIVSQVIMNVMGISAWHKEQRGRTDAHVTRGSGCRCSFYQRTCPWVRHQADYAYTVQYRCNIPRSCSCYPPANSQVDIVLYLRKLSVLLAVAIVRVPVHHDCLSLSWRVCSHIASVANLYFRGPRFRLL